MVKVKATRLLSSMLTTYLFHFLTPHLNRFLYSEIYYLNMFQEISISATFLFLVCLTLYVFVLIKRTFIATTFTVPSLSFTNKWQH